MKKVFLISSALWVSITFFACEKNTGTTYQDIKKITLTSCATAGCHDAGTAQLNVNMSSYATMSGSNGHKNILHKNGNGFQDRVLIRKDMPPLGTLSQADLDLLQSWADNNFRESN